MRFLFRGPAVFRVFFPLFVALSVLTGCRHAEVGRKAPATITVGAWNMEWLGNAERRPDQPAPEAVAHYIRSSHASVVALEEICETEPNSLKNSILEKTVGLLSQGGGAWHYKMFDSKAIRGQNCGVMWDSSVVRAIDAETPFPLAVDRGESTQHIPKWDRAPYAVQFSAGPGKTDFVLIPVHMKSNSRGSGGDTVVHRGEEAAALLRALPAVEEHYRGKRDLERDIVILGDFNTLHHTEPALAAYEAGGFSDLNPADQPTQQSGHYEPAPFDRVLVPRSQKEFAGSKLTIVNDGYAKTLSDHHMVTTEVRVMRDDD